MSNKIQLGTTSLMINPVGLGTNAVGGHNLFPNLDEEAGKELVRTAIRNGINFLDTAFIYGPERSEELIGEVMKELQKRQEVIIATKAAHKIVGDNIVIDNSPAFLKQAVDDALKRLQTDVIDLFYIHFPDKDTPKDEAVGALKRLKDEGKIRAIGVSNFSLAQLKEANKDGYVDVYQGTFNLLQREAEKEIFPYAKANKISFIPSFPLASGLLTGKFKEDTIFSDSRAKKPHFQGEAFKKNLEKVNKLRTVANNKGVDIVHVVLAWYLSNETIDVIIPGAKRAEQVLNNLKTLEVKLSVDEYNQIDSIFRG